jgi:hypothetical protein
MHFRPLSWPNLWLSQSLVWFVRKKRKLEPRPWFQFLPASSLRTNNNADDWTTPASEVRPQNKPTHTSIHSFFLPPTLLTTNITNIMSVEQVEESRRMVNITIRPCAGVDPADLYAKIKAEITSQVGTTYYIFMNSCVLSYTYTSVFIVLLESNDVFYQLHGLRD